MPPARWDQVTSDPRWDQFTDRERWSIANRYWNNVVSQSPDYQGLSDEAKLRVNERFMTAAKESMPKARWGRMEPWKKVLTVASSQGLAAMAMVNEAIPGQERYSGALHERMAKAVGGAVTGSDLTKGGDYLYQWGIRPESNAGKFARETVGFVLENLVDWTNYVGIGGLTKAGEGARRAGQLAKTASEQAQLGQRAAFQILGKPVVKGTGLYKLLEESPLLKQLYGWQRYRALRAAFNKFPNDPELAKMMKEANNEFMLRVGIGFEDAKQVKDGIMNLAEKLKTSPEDVASKITKHIENKTKSGIPEMDEVIDWLNGSYGKMLREGQDAKVLAPLGKRLEDEVAAGEKEIRKLSDLLNKIGEGQEPPEWVVKQLDSATEKYLKASAELAKTKEMGYAPHVVSHNVRQWIMEESAKRGSPIKAAKVDAAMSRMKVGTVDEINKVLSELNLEGVLDAKRFDEWFSKNPAYQYAVRIKGHAKAMTWAGLMDNVGETFGMKVGDAPEGWIKNIGDTPGFERLAGYAFPEEIADQIIRYGDRIFNEDIVKRLYNAPVLGKFVEFGDKIANFYKPTMLFLRGGYWNRNMVGNLWNMHLRGFNLADPRVVGDVMNGSLIAMRGGIEDAPRFLVNQGRRGIITEAAAKTIGKIDMNKPIKGLEMTRAQLYELAKKFQVVGTGQVGGEILEDKLTDLTLQSLGQSVKDIRKGGKYTKDALKHIGKGVEHAASTRWMAEALQWQEEGFRLGVFMNELKKGATPYEASELAKEIFFDYTAIGPADQAIRRGAWFWAWTRKNIPYQFQQALHKPGRGILMMERAKRTLAGGPTPEFEEKFGDDRRQAFMGFLHGRSPVRLGRPTVGKGGVSAAYFPLENFIPTADIFRMLRPSEAFTEMLNPIVKGMIEAGITHRVTYTDEPIKEYKGQKVKYLGHYMDKEVAYALRNIPILNDFNALFGKYSEEMIEKLNYKPTDQLSKEERAIRFLTGFRIYRYDILKTMDMYKYRMDQYLNEIDIDRRSAMKRGDIEEAKRLIKLRVDIEVELKKNYYKETVKGIMGQAVRENANEPATP